MRLFGYPATEHPPEPSDSQELAEITLAATAEELRAMAQFLLDCAAEMDRMGPTFDHVHLSDRIKTFQSSPHFVVVRD